MKTIILEGASTSGKTTIKEKLKEILTSKGMKFKVVEEDKTLLPYLDNPDLDRSLKAMHDILDDLENDDVEVTIIDRLYFTHVLINNRLLSEFSEVEKRLLPFNPIIVFLKMDEGVIKGRVFEAIKHRDKSWGEHVKSKGTEEEIENWYIATQRKLEGLYNQTELPKVTFDTTDKQFDDITEVIYKNYIKELE